MLSNEWTPLLILKQSWDRKLYPISPQALPWTLTLNLFSIHTFSKLVAIWTLVLWQLLEAEHHRAHPGLWQKTSLCSLRSFKFGQGQREGGLILFHASHLLYPLCIHLVYYFLRTCSLNTMPWVYVPYISSEDSGRLINSMQMGNEALLLVNTLPSLSSSLLPSRVSLAVGRF